MTPSQSNAEKVELREIFSTNATGMPVTIRCSTLEMTPLNTNISVSGDGMMCGYQMPCKAKTKKVWGEEMPLKTAKAISIVYITKRTIMVRRLAKARRLT
jgi:hypothetical protein